jgi:hypothetical protein
MPAAAQHPPDWQTEAARQVVGLIEAALQGAPRMQRHRHDGISAAEDVSAGRPHQGGQG